MNLYSQHLLQWRSYQSISVPLFQHYRIRARSNVPEIGLSEIFTSNGRLRYRSRRCSLKSLLLLRDTPFCSHIPTCAEKKVASMAAIMVIP